MIEPALLTRAVERSLLALVPDRWRRRRPPAPYVKHRQPFGAKVVHRSWQSGTCGICIRRRLVYPIVGIVGAAVVVVLVVFTF